MIPFSSHTLAFGAWHLLLSCQKKSLQVPFFAVLARLKADFDNHTIRHLTGFEDSTTLIICPAKFSFKSSLLPLDPRSWNIDEHSMAIGRGCRSGRMSCLSADRA